jgi:hypothetical protein
MHGPSIRRRLASGGRVCAVEHKDCANRRAAGSHDGVLGRNVAFLRKAEPVQSPNLPSMRSLGNSLCKGLVMQEQLAILDLGDAMVETRCSITGGQTYDYLYGPFHWTC